MSTYGVICCRNIDEQALKPDQLGDRVAQHRQRAVDRRARLARDRHVAVDVIDDRGVERLLLLEQRRDGAAHAGDEAAAQAAGAGGASIFQSVLSGVT